ncbi:hypothetical protein [Hymenobacter antarcticus]|uniref:DUF4224 domain-containing protein n=1 Tax=Hymenobacter antarcticus TaxID=486270 RepID=A0ABP7Q7P6_9BACT
MKSTIISEAPQGYIEEVQRIGQNAVIKAQENLRRKGIPLCFSRNGRIYYEMPDGSIQTENPYPELLRQRGIVPAG